MASIKQNIESITENPRAGLTIVVVAAIVLEAIAMLQYWFAREGIRHEAENRARNELTHVNLEIKNITSRVEVAVQNMAWAVERDLARPDAMYDVTRKLLDDNKIIVGSAVAFEPNFFPDKGRQFSPYSYRGSEGVISKQLGTRSYDYHSMEWYTAPVAIDAPHWSEPYFDKGGGEMMMSTYSVPVHDKSGRIVGVFTADVSLDWLTSVMNRRPAYHKSVNILISRSGKIMACPVESLVMKKSINEVTGKFGDTTMSAINRSMLAGKSGQASVNDDEGKKYVYYAPVGSGTGWSMAVVHSDREIFGGLRRIGLSMLLLFFVGQTLIAFILYRTIRAHKQLQRADDEKQRAAGELRIASAIQRGMLPKTERQLDARHDLSLAASLVPAKAVGGDLYDFSIRDEKLFFCIGDVSGKGVPAALVMAVTRALFRNTILHSSSPARLLAAMNAAMTEMNEQTMFVTLFVGVLDLPTGRLRYSNAAHLSPLLMADGDEPSMLPVEANIPLGVLAEWNYEQQETTLKPGTTIFLYTDGLTEAERDDHSQLGKQRMIDAARGDNAPQAVLERMTQAVSRFVGEAIQSDDLTMLAIQYTRDSAIERLHRSLRLTNDVAQVPLLNSFMKEIAAELHLVPAETERLNLALEEAVVNVMQYGYPEDTTGNIEVTATADDTHLRLVISDDGIPFDPTDVDNADVTLDADDRPIGGLGVHLMRSFVDTINYNRIDNRNRLTLTRHL